METETSNKQYRAVDPVSRSRWALAFPNISHAAGKVLLALADHADRSKLTCWPSVETLARETQTTRRTVQRALRQLEAAGAITTERSRGRTSSLYRLIIPPNRVIPDAPTASSLRGSTASSLRPNRVILTPQPRHPDAVQPRHPDAPTEPSLEQSKEQQQQQHLRGRERPAVSIESHGQHPAAAANHSVNGTDADKRHACPQCEHTWPKQFGTTCFKCQCDVERAHRHEELLSKSEEDDISLFEKAHPSAPPVSKTAMRLFNAMGRQIPASWLKHQDLKQLIGNRDFKEVCDIMVGIGSHQLPEPQPFFDAYSQHLQEHKRVEAELDAEIKALFPPPKQTYNGTNGARQAA